MEEWHVSDSEAESEKEEEPLCFEVSKMKEWLAHLETSATLEMDCYRAQRHRKHRKRRKVEREEEDVSETASEMRYTASITASTECRDTRRPSLSAYDFDDNLHSFPALLGTDFQSKKPQVLGPKPSKALKLDDVEGNMRREAERLENVWDQHNGHCNGGNPHRPPAEREDPFSLSFDDNEFDSPNDETSLFSKISNIETFLNQDGIV